MRYFCVILLLLLTEDSFADEKRYIYLLPNPVVNEVELGPVAEALHYGLEVGLHAGTSALLYMHGDSAGAAATYFGFQMLKTPPVINWQSMMDLEIRSQMKTASELNAFKKLERWPGFSNLIVVNTKDVQNRFLVAKRQVNQGFVFVETTEPIPLNKLKWMQKYWRESWGGPILIKDPENTFLRFNLSKSAENSPTEWKASLQSLLEKPNSKSIMFKREHELIPNSVLTNWRQDLKAFGKEASFYDRHFRESWLNDVSLNTTLVLDDGAEFPLGVVAKSGAVKDVLGKGFLTKTKNLFLYGTDEVGYVKVKSAKRGDFGSCANFYAKLVRPVSVKFRRELRNFRPTDIPNLQ